MRRQYCWIECTSKDYCYAFRVTIALNSLALLHVKVKTMHGMGSIFAHGSISDSGTASIPGSPEGAVEVQPPTPGAMTRRTPGWRAS